LRVYEVTVVQSFALGISLLSVEIDHLPAEAVVGPLATSVVPSLTWTTTSVFSLAVPSKVGLTLFERGSGPFVISTSGRSVSTSRSEERRVGQGGLAVRVG